MLKLFGAAAGAACVLLTAQTAQAQDVKTIIAKTNAVYRNMKTLKVSLQTTVTVDKQPPTGVQTDGQFIAGQKAHIVVVPQVKSGAAAAVGKQGAQVVDDGRISYMMDIATNKYMKQPHNPNMLPIMGLQYGLPFGGMNPKATYYTLLAPASVGGAACYTLQLAPPVQSGSTVVVIYIDKATYHVKQARLTQSNGKSTRVIQTLVKSEAVNAPLSNSAFIFTPPERRAGNTSARAAADEEIGVQVFRSMPHGRELFAMRSFATNNVFIRKLEHLNT